MNRTWGLCVSLGYLTLSLSGCESTGVGNPSQTTFALSIVNDDQAEPNATDPTVQLAPGQLHKAILNLGELDWVPCDPNLATVTVVGPFQVDLVSGQTEPSLGSVAVPEAGFCGLNAPLTTLSTSAGMLGRSIYFSGVRADGIPFVLYASMSGVLRLRARTGMQWGEASSAPLLWAIRPRRWITNDDLDQSTTDTDAAGARFILIDVDRHPYLYSFIRSRIGGASSLHLDSNANGVVDDAERTGSSWVGYGLPSLD